MVGNNYNEAGYYKVPAYGQGRILNQSVWDDFNLECFTCATALEAAQRVANGVPTWRYVHHGDWDNTRFVPYITVYLPSADSKCLPDFTPPAAPTTAWTYI